MNDQQIVEKGACYTLWESMKPQVEDKYIFGQEKTLRLTLIAFLSGGHVLIEGAPGTGKTVIAKLLSRLLSKSFKRIQFTSDLLPADILGASIYSPSDQSFHFIPGPIFADFVLADEINRTPPRTQSALLEAMEERKVTVEGETRELSKHFFVMATQNPREFEGTFPLPEAQLDRFLMKIPVSHLEKEIEQQMLRATLSGELPPKFESLSPLNIDHPSLESEISSVKVDDSLIQFVSEIIAATRNHPMLEWGSSFRGGMALIRSARVEALFSGRRFVIPDDIHFLAPITLGHRVKLSPDALVSDVTDQEVIKEILEKVPFPT